MEPRYNRRNTIDSNEEYRQAAEELHFISEDLNEDELDEIGGSGFDSTTSIGELTSGGSLG
jgi:uncharacterized Zn finger protein